LHGLALLFVLCRLDHFLLLDHYLGLRVRKLHVRVVLVWFFGIVGYVDLQVWVIFFLVREFVAASEVENILAGIGIELRLVCMGRFVASLGCAGSINSFFF